MGGQMAFPTGTGSTQCTQRKAPVLRWGFHYPISTYAKEVAFVLKPVTGRLIIQGLKDQAAMERYFTCDVPKSRFCCVGCRDPSLSPVHPDNAAAPASAP